MPRPPEYSSAMVARGDSGPPRAAPNRTPIDIPRPQLLQSPGDELSAVPNNELRIEYLSQSPIPIHHRFCATLYELSDQLDALCTHGSALVECGRNIVKERKGIRPREANSAISNNGSQSASDTAARLLLEIGGDNLPKALMRLSRLQNALKEAYKPSHDVFQVLYPLQKCKPKVVIPGVVSLDASAADATVVLKIAYNGEKTYESLLRVSGLIRELARLYNELVRPRQFGGLFRDLYAAIGDILRSHVYTGKYTVEGWSKDFNAVFHMLSRCHNIAKDMATSLKANSKTRTFIAPMKRLPPVQDMAKEGRASRHRYDLSKSITPALPERKPSSSASMRGTGHAPKPRGKNEKMRQLNHSSVTKALGGH